MRPTSDTPPILTWHIDDGGIQVYDDDHAPDGWLAAARVCPACALHMVIVVPNHAQGFECPACGYVDMLYTWEDD